MKISKLGIFVLVSMVSVLAGSCTFYYRVMSRKSLVDGAKAYNERKFDVAEDNFRRAVGYDEDLTTFEGKTAQLFLARTLHSGFAGNRKDTKRAEEAIVAYKKTLNGFLEDVIEKKAALAASPDDALAAAKLDQSEKTVGSIVSAVASLYENLQQDAKWMEWQESAAKNDKFPGSVRSNVYISLAAREYKCANDITDDDTVKKTVVENNEQVFNFVKPEKPEDFDKLKGCVEKGSGMIDSAIKLNPESDSAWSYRTSLLVQKARIAQMEGDATAEEKFKTESDAARKQFEKFAAKRKKAEEEQAMKEAEARAKEAGKKASEKK